MVCVTHLSNFIMSYVEEYLPGNFPKYEILRPSACVHAIPVYMHKNIKPQEGHLQWKCLKRRRLRGKQTLLSDVVNISLRSAVTGVELGKCQLHSSDTLEHLKQVATTVVGCDPHTKVQLVYGARLLTEFSTQVVSGIGNNAIVDVLWKKCSPIITASEDHTAKIWSAVSGLTCFNNLKCLDISDQQLPCGHELHEECICKMRRRGGSAKCPLCRATHPE